MNPERLQSLTADDCVFWDRLAEMPPLEAEQELVLRREELTLATNMLRNKMADSKIAGRSKEATEIGNAIRTVDSQLSLIGERIKYLRKVEDHVRWRDAVLNVLGQDALEACVIWRIQQGQEADNMRRRWAGKDVR